MENDDLNNKDEKKDIDSNVTVNDKRKNKKARNIFFVAIVLILTNTLTFFAANYISFKLPGGKVLVSRKTFENVIDFEKLFTVKDKIDAYYLDKDYISAIDTNKLIDGAAKGMVAALNDPYSVYMDKDEFADFTKDTTGKYVGLGIQVSVENDKLIVSNVFENSPAENVGIVEDDVIKSVNGTAVSGSDLQKAVAMMQGNKGEKVELVLVRGNKELSFSPERAEIEMVTVKGEMVKENIGYIKVTMFDENTAENFEKAIKSLKEKGMKSLIVDLRNNPGGLLDQTVKMTSEFVGKGKIITYTQDKYGEKKNYASEGGIAQGMPLTILTNSNTASASEIFTGAIKDYGLGTVVGVKTFGKGVVQTTFYKAQQGFDDGTALKLTISKYYTPKGENIHGKGIAPDIEIENPKDFKINDKTRSEDSQYNKALETAESKIK